MKVRPAELALAAARTRLLGELLDDPERDRLIQGWNELLEQLDASRSEGSAELALVAYRVEVEERLADATAAGST